MDAIPSGIEVVNKEVKEIRNQAQNEMLLSEDSDREKVLEYLLALKEQVDSQQAEAARINKYQTLFKVRQEQSDASVMHFGAVIVDRITPLPHWG